MRLRTIATLTSQAVRNLKRPTCMTTTVVVMACMLALSLFTLVAVNLTVIGRQLQAGVELRVFLLPDAGPDAVASLERSIGAIPGVSRISYVPKDEALRRLEAQLGDENGLFIEDMPYNPLPDSFDVSVRRADEAESIARRIQELEGVEDIVYGREMVRNLVGALRVMWAATGAIAVVVLVGASMVVANTIKLSVLAHNREIETMRLVGASDAFILFPFVVEGLLIGVIGAAVASLMVFAAYSLLIRWIGSAAPFLKLVADPAWLASAALSLVGFGAVVGLSGTIISVRRHLRVDVQDV